MLETMRSQVLRFCKVVKIWETLDDSDKEIYAEAINDWKTWPASTLARELRKRGLVISDNVILRHRDEMCACKERPF